MATDYLAVDSVKRLTFHGFRLGFHGHQHQSGTGAVYVHTDEDEVMAVVSASSLCAGRRDLSPGRLRGFNIVSIDPADCNCDVSARLMDFSAVISPEYCFNRGRGNRQVRWTRFRNEGTEAESLNTLVLAAEAKLRSGQADQARTLLLPALAKLDDFGRALLLEAMLALGNAVEAWSTLGPSLSPEQASQLAGVLVEAGRIGETKALLEHFLDRLSPIVKRELEARIRQMTISLGGRDVRG
jgi:ribosomal protein L24E